MTDTTNLSDLPGKSNNNENIVLDTQPMYNPNVPEMQNVQVPPNVSQLNSNNIPNQQRQQEINRVVSDIQQASAAGATQLPSRDIEMNPSNVAQDPQVMPNFIPPMPPQMEEDYIKEYYSQQQMREANQRKENKSDTLNTIYDELQTPILIFALVFIFQLPFFNNNFKYLFPFCFSIDGNPNLGGYLSKSFIFALLYFMLSKIMTYFSEI